MCSKSMLFFGVYTDNYCTVHNCIRSNLLTILQCTKIFNITHTCTDQAFSSLSKQPPWEHGYNMSCSGCNTHTHIHVHQLTNEVMSVTSILRCSITCTVFLLYIFAVFLLNSRCQQTEFILHVIIACIRFTPNFYS